MKKYWAFLTVALLLVSALLLLSCAQASPSPASSQTIAPKTSALAAKVAPIEFRYATSTAVANTPPLDAWQWASDELYKRTEGRVKFTIYFGTVAKATQEADALRTGLCDMTDCALSMYAQVWPLCAAFDMPSVGFPETVQGLLDFDAALAQVYKDFPALQDYWKEFKVLDIDGLPTYHLAAKKLLKVPEDAKGIKFAASGQRGKLISLIGGAAIPVATPEVYQALQTGQVDAAVIGFSGIKLFRALEITKYYNTVSFGGLTRVQLMSKDAFNKMTPGDQKIFMDLIPEILERGAKSNLANSDAGRAEVLKLNQTIYNPTKEEMALWEKAQISAEDSWLQSMAQAGVGDASKGILSKLRELAAQSRAKANSK
jgi:TRAP-type transport system periplasmic protein